ncbi:gliding motility-associated C-terminal domain-containing protein [Runella sp. MFBS21]|uniref:gliding motility-associated C-terminal domain-containing protein n=1 Tax=Runella sp. MFBS21 TaxID=3034018 RepID=UPI0023F6C062|nr:gliding motility-associated C-terminal domain-containing protein [Runella sp. MFBS21]MDF7822245.1 gliding motility-associated C-terminal domain-containing protein [Runella sp. MFBS21]
MRHLTLRFLLFLMCVMSTYYSYATHVRAGEITAKRKSDKDLTYTITLNTYHDEIGGRMASDGQNDVTFCIRPFVGGTGSTLLAKRRFRGAINNATSLNIFEADFSFSSPGVYVISVGIENRNDGVVNMSNSVNTPFYVETVLVINASLGLNKTPVMLNPPLDSARIGQKFCHNPAAFDADGDSLSYRLSIPKRGEPGTCINRVVDGYRDPALGINPDARNELQNGPATFTINPITGDLCWDAPAVAGIYNVAFIIEEWRDGVKIGEVVRDMQIVVADGINRRPIIDPVANVCVEAGNTVTQIFRATDPDNNRMIFSAYGGVFNTTADGQPITNPADALIAPSYATFTPTPTQPQTSPAIGTFRWLTNCNHVREAPYDVVVKVEDLPARTSIQLASLESFSIRVVSPKPVGLTARASGAAVPGFILNWTAYQCQLPGAQIAIYRKEGCSGGTFSACTNPGDPLALGYTEIAKVAATATTYTDNNNGLGLRQGGVQYSYRIRVIFALPQGGTSPLSDETCLDLPSQIPVLTNVTVDTTSSTRGVITVKWTRPPFAPGDVPGPYQYRLSRATGLNGTNYAVVATINTNLGNNADTIFVDRNLNTLDNGYRYRLEFFHTLNGTLTSLGTTEAASSVRLAASPASQGVRLEWQAFVPWRNENQTHRVYREVRNRPGTFNLIAEVPVQGANTFTYLDNGVDRFLADGNASITFSTDSTYCYRVETVGTYDSPRIRVGQLFNFSQVFCASPSDSTRPCPPVLTLDPLDCNDATTTNCPDKVSNDLNWTYPSKDANNRDCAPAATYNVYFAATSEGTFQRIGQTTAPVTNFRHGGLDSYAGCYYVTAVTRFNRESERSNIVCKDNCTTYRLPNVFTPNNDGKNDLFQPLTCPLFVESVVFVVYNRWGQKLFETTNPSLNWDGKTSDGQEVPAGTYFYQATVKFKTIQPTSEAVVIKGWVQLVR